MKFLKKLSSRKLWAAFAGIATGIAIAFGIDEGVISTIAGGVMAVVSAIAYIRAEGKVDAASVATAAQGVETAVNAINGVAVDEAKLIATECPKIIIPSDEGDEPDEADEMADEEDDDEYSN